MQVELVYKEPRCSVTCRIRLSVIPLTVARQAPPSMGFSGQEYWSGLPFPSPGAPPDPRTSFEGGKFYFNRAYGDTWAGDTTALPFAFVH